MRRRLLEAAVQLFVEQGYDGASMDDIAARADVSRATVFNYFARKDDFVTAWVAGRRAIMMRALAEDVEEPVPTALRLERSLMAMCEVYEADAEESRVMACCWVRTGMPLLPESYATADLFAGAIRDGLARGDVRAGADADAAGRVLVDAYFGSLYRWAAADRPQANALRDELMGVLQVVLDGLLPDRER